MQIRIAFARFAGALVAIAIGAAACSTASDAPTQQNGNSPTSGIPQAGADASVDADAGGGDAHAAIPDSSTQDVADASTLVQSLLALTARCNVASNGKFKTGGSSTATVDICRLNGAYFWKAGMDIDCDGQSTAECNASTDPKFSNQTAFTQSNGRPLVSAQLSYYVIPGASSRFNYTNAGIHGGAVGIVIYNGAMRYGVFGDIGATDQIGSASYAMASHLGINPSPTTGGVASGVTYFVFTGSGAVPSALEDHGAAVTLGEQLTTILLQNN